MSPEVQLTTTTTSSSGTDQAQPPCSPTLVIPSIPSTSSPSSSSRLVTYGTLSPNCPNHHRLSHVVGRWYKGTIRGTLVQSGWGAALGFPALSIDAAGPKMDVWVLEADRLEEEYASWLDAFEGDEYERVVVQVETEEGTVEAQVYVHAEGKKGAKE